MLEFVGKSLTFLLGIPAVRLFLEGVALRVFSDIFFKSDSDPKFRDQFLDLTRQLAQAQTEEEKRAIELKIHALRNPSTTQ